MFIDEVQVRLIAGRWWDGLVSWRKEKYIPKWWPRWWNGWDGWNVYLQTTNNLNTLSDFRHKKIIKAWSGEWGMKKNMNWKLWEDLIIKVPVWTIVKDANTLEVIQDLDENHTKLLICRWWRWWYGNAHFVSPTRRAPRFAEFWDIWEEREVILELKLVRDIGIIGIPSAGKSSLISNITNMKAKVWDYPFTTLVPNLWVLEYKDKAVVLADVPGLIPWASNGKWLGIQFLKHIERTKSLLHLLDISRLDQVFSDYQDIRSELGLFSKEILDKKEVVVLNKADLLDKEMIDHIVSEFKNKYKPDNIFIISSATNQWIDKLKDYLISSFSSEVLNTGEIEEKEIKIIDLKEQDTNKLEVEYLWDYKFKIANSRLEQIVRMTDFNNLDAVWRVYDVLDKMWVNKKIEAKLEQISKDEDVSFDFFFEWSNVDDIRPVAIIWDREVELNNLRFVF